MANSQPKVCGTGHVGPPEERLGLSVMVVVPRLTARRAKAQRWFCLSSKQAHLVSLMSPRLGRDADAGPAHRLENGFLLEAELVFV